MGQKRNLKIYNFRYTESLLDIANQIKKLIQKYMLLDTIRSIDDKKPT